jgi:hypothetical protein
MGLWALIALRIGALSLERVAFHRLGRGTQALAATMVAYGGAAVGLWIWALAMGDVHWVAQGFWPGAIYAGSFFLYTAALAEGPVGVVSGFANVTVLFLFVAHPHWDLGTMAGLGFFLVGAAFLVSWNEPLSHSVVWMVASGFLLACGRIMDMHQATLFSPSYAASLFTSVVLWLAIPTTFSRLWPAVARLTTSRASWALVASGANGLAYLTVLALLPRLYPHLLEAVSSWSAVATTLAAVWLLGEGQASRKVAGAFLITGGTTMLLLFSHA